MGWSLILSGSYTTLARASDDPSVVALFGDSITVGYNASYQAQNGSGTTEKGCPTIYLKNIMAKQPPRTDQESCPTTIHDSPVLDANREVRDVTVVNWGRGGSSTDVGQDKILSDLNFTKANHPGKAYYVLIMYGTNDFGYGISSSTTGFNTRLMIQRARSVGFTPIIGTLIPRSDRDVGPYNVQIVGAANLEGAFVVDHYSRFIAQPGGWTSLVELELGFSGNLIRLHPNNHGYLVIAETWFDDRLRDLIEPEPRFVGPAIYLLLLDD